MDGPTVPSPQAVGAEQLPKEVLQLAGPARCSRTSCVCRLSRRPVESVGYGPKVPETQFRRQSLRAWSFELCGDSLEHYCHRIAVRRVASASLRLPYHDALGLQAFFMVGSGPLENGMLVCGAILIYATFMATNHCRVQEV